MVALETVFEQHNCQLNTYFPSYGGCVQEDQYRKTPTHHSKNTGWDISN